MRSYLVEVEHQIELADVVKERVLKGRGQSEAERKTNMSRHGGMRHTEHLHEQVDCLQVCEFVVVRIHTDAEEQAGIAAVHDLMIPELARPHASALS